MRDLARKELTQGKHPPLCSRHTGCLCTWLHQEKASCRGPTCPLSTGSFSAVDIRKKRDLAVAWDHDISAHSAHSSMQSRIALGVIPGLALLLARS